MAYSEDVEAARAFAQAKHSGQTDKAGKPYTGHLERVASRLTDPAQQVVAWLHDTMEDTGTTYEEIAAMFGPDTADCVAAMTHREGEDYMDYVRRLSASPVARAVKISDLIDNSSLCRLPVVTIEDVRRQRKYNDALRILLE